MPVSFLLVSSWSSWIAVWNKSSIANDYLQVNFPRQINIVSLCSFFVLLLRSHFMIFFYQNLPQHWSLLFIWLAKRLVHIQTSFIPHQVFLISYYIAKKKRIMPGSILPAYTLSLDRMENTVYQSMELMVVYHLHGKTAGLSTVCTNGKQNSPMKNSAQDWRVPFGQPLLNNTWHASKLE